MACCESLPRRIPSNRNPSVQEIYPQNANLPPLFKPLTIRGLTFNNRIWAVSERCSWGQRYLLKCCGPRSLRCASTAPMVGMRPTGIWSTLAGTRRAGSAPYAWKARPSCPKAGSRQKTRSVRFPSNSARRAHYIAGIMGGQPDSTAAAHRQVCARARHKDRDTAHPCWSQGAVIHHWNSRSC